MTGGGGGVEFGVGSQHTAACFREFPGQPLFLFPFLEFNSHQRLHWQNHDQVLKQISAGTRGLLVNIKIHTYL